MLPRIICSLRFTISESGWIVAWRSSLELIFFCIFDTDAKLFNLILDKVMGLKILKRKCACRSNFKIIWKPLSMKMVPH